jgi:hypothetical protein
MKKLIPFLVPAVLLVSVFLPVQGAISGPTESGFHEVTTARRQIGENPEALIWTWGLFEGSIPLSIGVTFTDPALEAMFTAAFNGFPRALSHLTAPHLAPARVYDLPFPEKVRRKTPFDHVGWFANAQGHNPLLVFGVPHVDIHFFTITVKERAAISGELNDPKLLEFPPAGFLPADFCLPLFTAVPPFCKLLSNLTDTDIPGSNDAEQGLHWVDSFAPELTGKPFEQIFIYGSYDGEVNFWEPMITKQFFEKVRSFLTDLQATEDTIVLTFAIKQPEQFHEAGFYPTLYSIRYDAEARVFSVSLDDFVKRKAAEHGKKKGREDDDDD